MTSNFYVSNWKSSYDIDNEMARNIARVKKKMEIIVFIQLGNHGISSISI